MDNDAKPLGLTELASTNIKLTDELQKHTAARNYLYKAAKGEVAPPVMTLADWDSTTAGESVQAVIDLRVVPEAVAQEVIVAALEHEERAAFTAWRNIHENAKLAVACIDNLEKQRAALVTQGAASAQYHVPEQTDD